MPVFHGGGNTPIPVTLNPADVSGFTLSVGNTQASDAGSGTKAVRSQPPRPYASLAGKKYWEMNVDTDPGANRLILGVALTGAALATIYATVDQWGYVNDGTKNNGAGNVSFGTAYGAGSRVAIAFDGTAGLLFFGLISGGVTTWQASGDPVSGANPAFSGLGGLSLLPIVIKNSGPSSTAVITACFGRASFAGTPPAGYAPLVKFTP